MHAVASLLHVVDACRLVWQVLYPRTQRHGIVHNGGVAGMWPCTHRYGTGILRRLQVRFATIRGRFRGFLPIVQNGYTVTEGLRI